MDQENSVSQSNKNEINVTEQTTQKDGNPKFYDFNDVIVRIYKPSFIIQAILVVLAGFIILIGSEAGWVVLFVAGMFFVPIIIGGMILFSVFRYIEKRIFDKLSLSGINQFDSPFLLTFLILRTQLYIPFFYALLSVIMQSSGIFNGNELLGVAIFTIFPALVLFSVPLISIKKKVS